MLGIEAKLRRARQSSCPPHAECHHVDKNALYILKHLGVVAVREKRFSRKHGHCYKVPRLQCLYLILHQQILRELGT